MGGVSVGGGAGGGGEGRRGCGLFLVRGQKNRVRQRGRGAGGLHLCLSDALSGPEGNRSSICVFAVSSTATTAAATSMAKTATATTPNADTFVKTNLNGKRTRHNTISANEINIANTISTSTITNKHQHHQHQHQKRYKIICQRNHHTPTSIARACTGVQHQHQKRHKIIANEITTHQHPQLGHALV